MNHTILAVLPCELSTLIPVTNSSLTVLLLPPQLHALETQILVQTQGPLALSSLALQLTALLQSTCKFFSSHHIPNFLGTPSVDMKEILALSSLAHPTTDNLLPYWSLLAGSPLPIASPILCGLHLWVWTGPLSSFLKPISAFTSSLPPFLLVAHWTSGSLPARQPKATTQDPEMGKKKAAKPSPLKDKTRYKHLEPQPSQHHVPRHQCQSTSIGNQWKSNPDKY